MYTTLMLCDREASAENADKEHRQTYPGSEVRKGKMQGSSQMGRGKMQQGSGTVATPGNRTFNTPGNRTFNTPGNRTPSSRSGRGHGQTGLVKQEVKTEPVMGNEGIYL